MLRLGLVQLLVTEGQTEKNISRIRALTEKYASEEDRKSTRLNSSHS